MSDESKTCYIVQKIYVNRGTFAHERNPIAASTNYEQIVNYVEQWCSYIQKFGDPWFTDHCEHKIIWKGVNYYQIGYNNQTERIIFRIVTCPMMAEKSDE